MKPSATKRSPKMFILFDGRAKSGDTDRAAVMDTAETVHEAWSASRQCWEDVDAIWYEHIWDEVQSAYVEVAPRWDIGKGILL